MPWEGMSPCPQPVPPCLGAGRERQGCSHGTWNGRIVPVAARKADLVMSPWLLERQDWEGVPMGTWNGRMPPWLLEKCDLECPYGTRNGRTWHVPTAPGMAG